MNFDIDNISGEIKHPNFPEVKLLVRRPDDIEQMTYFTMLSQFEIPVAVLNPIDNTPLFEPVRGEDGEIQTYSNEEAITRVIVSRIQTVPIAPMTKFLCDTIIGWEGFIGKNNQPIPYSPKVLHLVFSPKLHVKVEKKEGQEGIDQPFFMYALKLIVEEKTFNPDPLV